MKSYRKAWLIGAIFAIALTTASHTFLYYSPHWGYSKHSLSVELTFFLVYVTTGLLTAFWLSKPVATRQGIVAGAKAGLIVGILEGITSVAIDPIFEMLKEGYFRSNHFPEFDLIIYIVMRIFQGLVWSGYVAILSAISSGVYMLIKNKFNASSKVQNP